MKRLAALITAVFVLCAAAFSKGFFDGRVFEYKITAPVDISNNVFAVNDIMKETVVIDLRKIAESIPDDGFAFVMGFKPNIQVNLNIAAVSVGTRVGLDAYGKIGISKGLFDFIGKGFKTGDELDVTLSPTLDLFAYSELNFGLKLSRFQLYVKPGLFTPLLSTSGSKGGVKILNTEDGSIIIKTDAQVDVYSSMNIEKLMDKNFDPTNLNVKSLIFDNLGFDLAMGMSLPLSKRLVVSADARIPIVPATINYRTSMSFSSESEISMSSMENANFEMPSPEFSTTEISGYKLNRPMKVLGYVDFYPLGNFLDLRLGGGLGIYHPFMDTAKAYPQYYLGMTLNLINMLKLSLSTEYTDQVFVHQLGAVVNLRLVEVDAGVSMQSSSFTKSWLITGLGAYVVLCVGF
ncbi:MAG: hypothetical protein IJ688_12165 [Treponema sp.]|nr:hypothetical protein [Treponema sp.]